jgi:hypothetical protein
VLRMALVALTAPLLFATMCVLVLAGTEYAGRPLFQGGSARNSAEAAALADPATMLVFLRRGENPSRDYPVRPHIISSEIVRATTLEAALWARSLEMIRLLDRIGAIVENDQRRDLACLAADLDLPQVKAYLAPAHPCVPGEALDRVAARSRPPGRRKP